jgi:hypothetical protein
LSPQSTKRGSAANSNNISEDLIMMIAEVGVYYFIAIFVGYQKQIAQIYVDLSDFTNFEKPQNFDKVNRRLSLLSKMYKSFIDFAIINVCLSPFVSKRFCEKLNQEREFKEICGLLATTWMPFNIDVFPIKQIFFLFANLHRCVYDEGGGCHLIRHHGNNRASRAEDQAFEVDVERSGQYRRRYDETATICEVHRVPHQHLRVLVEIRNPL